VRSTIMTLASALARHRTGRLTSPRASRSKCPLQRGHCDSPRAWEPRPTSNEPSALHGTSRSYHTTVDAAMRSRTCLVLVTPVHHGSMCHSGRKGRQARRSRRSREPLSRSSRTGKAVRVITQCLTTWIRAVTKSACICVHLRFLAVWLRPPRSRCGSTSESGAFRHQLTGRKAGLILGHRPEVEASS
jgi:hypothetical protein